MLLQAQSVEEPAQLSSGDGEALFVRLLGPLEASAFEASVVEPETIVIPDKDFELITSSVAEDEEAVAEEIEFEDLGDQGSEAVDGFPEIGASAGEIDFGVVV